METSFIDARIEDFTKVLASKAPVPGGGGASALAAGLGISLAAMVAEIYSKQSMKENGLALSIRTKKEKLPSTGLASKTLILAGKR